jgi:flagellar basal body-associated protein FliL
MVSSDTPESDGQLSGSESAESGGEQTESIPEEEKSQQSSGNELDESGDEGSESIKDGEIDEQFSGNELDEAGDEGKSQQSSGDELDEPGDEGSESIKDGEIDEQFSGNELDEAGDEGSESIKDEEKSQQSSGDELGESGDEGSESIKDEEKSQQSSGDELGEPGDEGSESIPDEKKAKDIWGKFRGKKRLSLFIAIGLSLLTGIISLFYLKDEKSKTAFHQGKGPFRFKINSVVIPKDQELVFQPFVIPLKKHKDFTYMSLSISFNLPNKELREELIEKKDQVRGTIYNILREEINKTNKVPPLEKIKVFIVRAVNMTLSTGKINEVYITHILSV